MSITISTDVFCDECSIWIHGNTGQVPRRKYARKAARASGWLVKRDKSGHIIDLCPECAQQPNAETGEK